MFHETCDRPDEARTVVEAEPVATRRESMSPASSGWINPHLAILGCPDVPLYLIVNRESATLVEGGLSGLTDLVWRQLNAALEDFGGIRHLRYWAITHSHYDHCGLLTTLKPRMPWVHIVGSPGVADALQSLSAGRTRTRLDDQASQSFCAAAPAVRMGWHDVPLYPRTAGTVLDIGMGMQLRTLPLPGHSACQFGFHCPQMDTLFVSDALGEYHAPTQWLPLVFDGLADYVDSLARIEQQGASLLALGHHGLVGGATARHAVAHAHDGLARHRDEARAVRGDPAAADALARRWTERHAFRSARILPQALHLASMQRMIRVLHAADT